MRQNARMPVESYIVIYANADTQNSAMCDVHDKGKRITDSFHLRLYVFYHDLTLVFTLFFRLS